MPARGGAVRAAGRDMQRMARRDTLVALAVLVGAGLFGGCASEPSAAVDGGGAGDGGGAPACGEPDVACPAALPFTSGACEGALHCSYGSHDAHCESGAWRVEPLCDGVPPGGSCLPPLVESCDAPYEGTPTGASPVSIGPVGEARAFTDGELVPIVFGSQGGAMIRWALRVGGADAPSCVRAHVRLAVDGGAPYEVAQTMTLHCGQSLATFAILSESPCETREYAITMTVTVDGLGETTASVRAMGGLCPRSL